MTHAEADAQATAVQFGNGATGGYGEKRMTEIDVGDIGADRQAGGTARDRLRAGQQCKPVDKTAPCIEPTNGRS